MAHELIRLKSSILNEPQLATIDTVNEVMEYLELRNIRDEIKLAELQMKMRKAQPMAFIDSPLTNNNLAYSIDGSIAQVNITGALSHKATSMEAICGARSYQSILADFKHLSEDKAVKTIVMNIDSGGGEATGAFEAAREIRSLSKGKRLIAFVDSLAASAAYALASIADEIVATVDAKLGSIGVVLPMMNYKEKLDKEGVKFLPIFAGKHKVLGHPALDLSENDKELLQDRVNALFDMFTGLVSENRPLTQEQVKDLDALVFMGEEAVSKGLADKLMTVSEFTNYLGGEMSLDVSKVENKKESASVAEVEESTKVAQEASAIEVMQSKMAELEAMVAQKEEALVVAHEAIAMAAQKEHEAKLQAFTDKAKEWAVFGVDSKAFADLAMKADASFVDLVASALDKASLSLEEAVTKEVGHQAEGVGNLKPSSAVADLLSKKYSNQ